jgi:hypothetical protein
MTADAIDALPERVARRYGADGAFASSGLGRPPRCSFAHGAAGVAYFLLRYGALAGDRRALDAAARWVALAERDLHDAEAFVVSERSRVFPDPRQPSPPPSSLYFGEAGVWCVVALVSGAQRDAGGVDRAISRFASIADAGAGDELDAVRGVASLLLGAALMVEELGDPPAKPLLNAGERLAERLNAVAAERWGAGLDPVGWLGAAHGWCGIAHALLRWCETTSEDPPPAVRGLLERLADTRLASGLWPRREGSSEVWPGWCHGSAGWVQLWTLASEVLGDAGLLTLADRPGAHAVAGDHGEGAGVCCGEAGEAYAALAIYRATGEDDWLEEAQRLAAHAADTPPGEEFPEHSLWRGDVGPALLITELGDPARAAMPLYRALG